MRRIWLFLVGAIAVLGVPAMVAAAHGFHYYTVTKTSGSTWAGYAVTGVHPQTVTGSWTMPTNATCGGQNDTAFWVGIDGYNTSTVEQTGVEINCQGGSPSLRPWYEFYPAAAVYDQQHTAKPGDKFTGTVTYSNGQYTTKLMDVTQGWTYSSPTQAVSGATDGTAEWIAERTLPFGSVTFTGCEADGKPISSYSSISQIDLNGSPAITTGALNSTGDGFTMSTNGSTGSSGDTTGSTPPSTTPGDTTGATGGQGDPGSVGSSPGSQGYPCPNSQPGAMPGGQGMPGQVGGMGWPGGQGMPGMGMPGSGGQIGYPCPQSQLRNMGSHSYPCPNSVGSMMQGLGSSPCGQAANWMMSHFR